LLNNDNTSVNQDQLTNSDESASITSSSNGIAPRAKTPAMCVAGAVLLVLAAPLLIWQGNVDNPALIAPHFFMPFHTLAEVFAVIVAVMIFITGWHVLDEQRPVASVVLACAFLAVAVLDAGHFLSYKGMPDLITPNSAHKAIVFWLAARLTAATALLVYVLLPQAPVIKISTRRWLLAGSLGFAFAVVYVGIWQLEWAPATFIPGEGLTRFKISAEIFVVLLHMLTLAAIVMRKQQLPGSALAPLVIAVMLMVVSELFFTLYSAVTDTANVLGHLYKVFAYLFLYQGMFLESVRAPVLRLHQARRDIEELAAHRERVREEERTRIAREIHDELGQWLTALRMDAALLDARYGDSNPELKQHAIGMKQTVDTTIGVVRNIASALRPGALDMGLVSAAEWLLAEFEQRTGIHCHLDAPHEDLELDDARATALFRTLQESLTNVVRHAQASRIDVSIIQEENGVLLQVIDDGVGFDPRAVRNKKSFGLMGMRERALMFDGESHIDSHPGSGTTVSVRIPTVVANG
jgi:signal transduction histidine kinase